MSEASDSELLQNFSLRRDERAFRALVARHGPLVMGVCRRMLRDDALAEDAFQSTFVVLAKKAGGLVEQRSLAAWLHTVTVRVCLRYREQAARQRKLVLEVGQMAMSSSKENDWAEIAPVLDEALAELNAKQRQVVTLCCMEGQSYERAAATLQVSVDTVRGQLARAREKLRGHLAKRGVIVAAAALPALLVPELTAQAVPAGVLNGATMAVCGGGSASATAVMIAESIARAMTMAKLAVTTLLVAAGLVVSTWATTWALAESGNPKGATDGAQKVALAEGEADVYGDATPRGVVARLGSVRFRHDVTRDLAVSPDGKVIATVGVGTQDVRLWGADGKLLRTLNGHSMTVDTVAFSNDGTKLASASWDNSVRIWEVDSGKSLKTLKASGYSLDWSRDGKWLAVGGGSGMKQPVNLRIFDTSNFEVKHEIAADPVTVNGVAFSPDGKKIFVGGKESARMFDVSTGELVWNLNVRDEKGQTLAGVADVAWSSDGKWVASIGLKGMPRVAIFDAADGKRHEVWNDNGFGFAGSKVRFVANDSQILASGSNIMNQPCVRLWDIATNRMLAESFGGETAIGLPADGKTIYQGGTFVTLRDPATLKETGESRPGHSAAIMAAGTLADGTFITISRDNTARFWDARGKQKSSVTFAAGVADEAAISADGKTFAVGFGERPGTAAFVCVYDQNGKERHLLEQPDWRLSFMALSANGKYLVVGAGQFLGGHKVRIYSAQTGVQVGVQHDYRGLGVAAAISADEQYVAISNYDGSIMLYSLPDMRVLTKMAGHPGAVQGSQVYGMAFSPDGKVLASAAEDKNGNFRLWNTKDGKEILKAQHPVTFPRSVRSVAFSPDGTLVATASDDGVIRVFDVKKQTQIGTLEGHNSPVGTVAFSRDGQFVLSGARDGLGYVWSTKAFVDAVK